MHSAHVLVRRMRGRTGKTAQGETGCCVLKTVRVRKSRSGRRARVEHNRLNFPNEGLNYFVSVLESNTTTKRDMESLL